MYYRFLIDIAPGYLLYEIEKITLNFKTKLFPFTKHGSTNNDASLFIKSIRRNAQLHTQGKCVCNLKLYECIPCSVACGDLLPEAGCGDLLPEVGCGDLVSEAGSGDLVSEAECGDLVSEAECGDLVSEAGCGTWCQKRDARTWCKKQDMETWCQKRGVGTWC